MESLDSVLIIYMKTSIRPITKLHTPLIKLIYTCASKTEKVEFTQMIYSSLLSYMNSHTPAVMNKDTLICSGATSDSYYRFYVNTMRLEFQSGISNTAPKTSETILTPTTVILSRSSITRCSIKTLICEPANLKNNTGLPMLVFLIPNAARSLLYIYSLFNIITCRLTKKELRV